MLRHSHEDRLNVLKTLKRMPKPNGSDKGTHPHDYNLNLATIWMMELAHVDIMHIHNKVHAGTTKETRKEMATELMKQLYSLESHLSSAAYAGIYYHINAVINE